MSLSKFALSFFGTQSETVGGGANSNIKSFYGAGFVKIWVDNCPSCPPGSDGPVPTPRLPPDTT